MDLHQYMRTRGIVSFPKGRSFVAPAKRFCKSDSEQTIRAQTIQRGGIDTWISKEVAHSLLAKDRLSILPVLYALTPSSRPLNRPAWPGPTPGWSDRGHPTRRCDLVRAGGETLAWCRTKHSDDPYCYSGKALRLDRRLDGKGQRRTISGVIAEEDHSKLSCRNRRQDP